MRRGPGSGRASRSRAGTCGRRRSRKPRAVFTLMSGTHGLDRNAITITHGDERTWVRGGAVGDKRGGIGDLGPAGDHLWTLAGGTRRGRQLFEASFAQRGMGESQRLGAGESARGQSGRAAWGWRFAGDSLGVRLSRGLDLRAQFAISDTASPMRRDAQANDAEVEWRRVTGAPWAVRLAVREARVVRIVEYEGGPWRRQWSEQSVWLAAKTSRPLAGGTLELQLGGGSDRSMSHPVAAPGVSWDVRQGDRSLRLFAERTIVPLWSDFDKDGTPFTQDTRAGGLEAQAGSADHARGTLSVLGGRAASRATLVRYPILNEGLVLGWRADPRPYRFLLTHGEVSARAGAFDGDAGGYALARERASSQTRVDPGLGGRAGIGVRFRAFAGDLGVHLRAEGAYVGARETDAIVVENIMLPGYTTLTLRATLTLGDAIIVIRGDNLGGQRQPESWIDPSQLPDYVLARDAGKVWRTEVCWPLFN